MNLLIDTYDSILRTFFWMLAFPLTEALIISFTCLYVLKKMGWKRFFGVKMLSLAPVSYEDEGLKENKGYRLFNDVLTLTTFFFIFVKTPVLLFEEKYFSYKDYIDKHTNDSYKLERDELFENVVVIGLPTLPFLWMPIVIGVNKYRQWVDMETFATWIYHENRKVCFQSGYKDSSCEYAMDIARALYRDNESLEIGLSYVEANKNANHYRYCEALTTVQRHAEQTDNIEMYKKWVKKRCEHDCPHHACRSYKLVQDFSDARLRMNIFSDRAKPSSFITK